MLDGERLLSWEAHAPDIVDTAVVDTGFVDTAVVDTTGAGDAFAAGFLAGKLHGEPVRRGLQRGVIAASFAIEGLGPDGLLATTPEQAEERLRATDFQFAVFDENDNMVENEAGKLVSGIAGS